MTFSIITVSFNAVNTIADTLRSVASQTYPHIEHILVDGGSEDGTMQTVDAFPHIGIKISEKDGGIYHAMNKGLAMASGDIIGMLNADDQYADKYVIERVMKAFEDPAIDAVYGNLDFVDPRDPARVVRRWRSQTHTDSDFYYGWMPPHPTFFVRKRIYEKYGNFDTRLKSAADYELMLRFLFKYRIHSLHLPFVMIHMRNGGKSTASLKNRLIANAEDREAWRINGLKPHFFTLILKPLRKLNQFFFNG